MSGMLYGDALVEPPSSVTGTGLFGPNGGFEDVDEGMLLDPPDPVDLLIAHTQNDDLNNKTRPLDFIRVKVNELKKENKRLKDKVLDLEQTLSIVQTAHEWTLGKGMTQEQAMRMQEIKALLEQAKKAKEEMQQFSGASRSSLYEKLRNAKTAVRREKQEKAEMKTRLMHAFDHARAHRDMYRRLVKQREEEHETWNRVLKEMKDRHNIELRRLHGDPAAMQSERRDQLSHFGEQVMGDLAVLQQHLKEVRQETVDNVVLENDDLEVEGDEDLDPDAEVQVFATTGATDAFGETMGTRVAKEVAAEVTGGIVGKGIDGTGKGGPDSPK
eukprot:TRINITY_DN4905_c0_g1_i1.p1 TRINITY_DN4905_c0_g1~~TRINITY_DN4905_c0_g1_i1.p1  ORF type:complete len:328 (+),score=100.41 TRINITY_DN4905_c0_g1_i1:65-1048(+)